MSVYAYKVSDATACKCRQCIGLVGDDGPHKSGYWVAYRTRKHPKGAVLQDGPAVKAWTKTEAKKKALES